MMKQIEIGHQLNLYSINNLAAYLHQRDDCSDFQKSRVYINISDEEYEYLLCLK